LFHHALPTMMCHHKPKQEELTDNELKPLKLWAKITLPLHNLVILYLYYNDGNLNKYIKATMKYYLIPVRMTITKKIKDSKCWWECREKRILVYCWWQYKMVQLLWNQHGVSSRIESRIMHTIQQSYFWIYIQNNWKQDLKEIFASMFIAALFTVIKRLKQFKCFI
jgi:hypothetical protein